MRRLLERLALPGGAWLEPTAGNGAIITTVNDLRADLEWTAVEAHQQCELALRATGAEVVIGDFLPTAAAFAAAGRHFRVALGNPPFSLAFATVQLCLEVADWVVMLEREPWLGDEEDRRAFFRNLVPDIYDIGRIDFDGGGGDSVPYAWFVWPPDRRGRRRGSYEFLPRLDKADQLSPTNLLLDLPPPPEQLELVPAISAAGGDQ